MFVLQSFTKSTQERKQVKWDHFQIKPAMLPGKDCSQETSSLLANTF